MTRNVLWVEAIVLRTAADGRFRQATVLLVFLIGGIGKERDLPYLCRTHQ